VSNGNYVEITSGLKDGDVVYVEAEEEKQSGIASLMSSMFGSQNFNNGGQRQNRQNRDFSNMPSMPGGSGAAGGFGGGSR